MLGTFALSLVQGALLLLAGLNKVNGDQSVYGKLNFVEVTIDSVELDEILNDCYRGLDFETCTPKEIDEDDRFVTYLPAYYDVQFGSSYCLECCAETKDSTDYWDLSCEIDSQSRFTSNVYGYEFRFARYRDLLDTGYITCPLDRTGCDILNDEVRWTPSF
jgi:hypothetical protein